MKELLEPIVGPSSNKKKVYHCTKCGSMGHNSAKCPQVNANLHAKTKDLKSGEYVIGSDPAEECGLSKEIYLEYNNTQQQKTTCNDFQLATNRILSYTLMLGYDEFVMTYYDILEFNNTTVEPLKTIVLREALNDTEAAMYISKYKGSFLEYLVNNCNRERNELMKFTSTMELDSDINALELQQDNYMNESQENNYLSLQQDNSNDVNESKEKTDLDLEQDNNNVNNSVNFYNNVNELDLKQDNNNVNDSQENNVNNNVNDNNNENELVLEQDNNNVNDSQENIDLVLEQDNNNNGNDSQEKSDFELQSDNKFDEKEIKMEKKETK
jgi:hypothetical protein